VTGSDGCEKGEGVRRFIPSGKQILHSAQDDMLGTFFSNLAKLKIEGPKTSGRNDVIALSGLGRE